MIMKTAKLCNYIDIMTKEEKKVYMIQWRLANKNEVKQHNKQWRLDNKEYIKEYKKQWHSDNKDKINEYLKQWYLNNQLPYHIVYLLPDHNYVGVTNQPYHRMNNHKNNNNRNISNWVELARYTDREEALAHEARLHDTGYEGGKVCYNTNGR